MDSRFSSSEIDVAWLTLNRSCNLGCSYCYAEGAPLSEMRFDTLTDLIDLISGIEVGSVIYSGGEPSCYPFIYDAVCFAKSKGLICGFPTSGLLYADFREAVSLAETGVDGVSLSLKGWSEASCAEKAGVDATCLR